MTTNEETMAALFSLSEKLADALDTIQCRAQISPGCNHGEPYNIASGDPDAIPADDGTWDGQTIICDPCYVTLMPLTPSGRGLTHELPNAIALARAEMKGQQHGDDK